MIKAFQKYSNFKQALDGKFGRKSSHENSVMGRGDGMEENMLEGRNDRRN